jgi:tRNA U34 5-carboxymethylaminomethyl modifying GTPase MnmE/TrmE
VAQAIGAETLRDADLVIWVQPANEPRVVDDLAAFEATPADRRLMVRTKLDLRALPFDPDAHELRVCALTGAGMAELRRAIRTRLDAIRAESPPAAVSAGLAEKLASVVSACTAAASAPELVAWELREFATALDRCLDDYSLTDNVLGRIFAHFCIGK